MFWVCLRDAPRRLGLPGNLIVPAVWIVPSLLLAVGKKWFLRRNEIIIPVDTQPTR